MSTYNKNSRRSNNGLLHLMLVLGILLPTAAIAQGRRPDAPPVANDSRRVDRLEQVVEQMQTRMQTLNQRVRVLEEELLRGPRPPQYAEINHTCMLVDSGFSKTFLGSGRSRLDAEYNARQSCSRSVHSAYCTGSNAKLRCDDNANSRGRGFLCVVVDTGFSRQFRGEGITAIAAEANAKLACQGSVHAAYCSGAVARCEEVY